MLGRALLFASLLSLGCSSSDFQVGEQNDAAGTDSNGSDGSTTSDGAPAGPCDPEPGRAKYCVTLELAKAEHPPYNAASGALGLGIDGKGRAYLALFDKDLSTLKPGDPDPVPKIVTPYPSESGEIGVEELPITLSGESLPGTYTLVASFADNLVAARPSGATLAGDFVLLPDVVDGKLAYPTMKLELGTVQKKTLKLRPNRKISVTMGFSDEFLLWVKGKPTVHGDGPTMFGLFDDPISSSTTFLSLDTSRCVDTHLQTAPTAPTVDFTTTVEGSHNVLIALFDYTSGPTFPGKGTLTSPMTGTYPRIDIKSDMWTASATVDFTGIPLGPYSDPSTVDPLKCK